VGIYALVMPRNQTISMRLRTAPFGG